LITLELRYVIDIILSNLEVIDSISQIDYFVMISIRIHFLIMKIHSMIFIISVSIYLIIV